MYHNAAVGEDILSVLICDTAGTDRQEYILALWDHDRRRSLCASHPDSYQYLESIVVNSYAA